jgi:RecA/RadA recombinase
MTGGAGTVGGDTAGGRAQGEPTGIPGLDAILGGGVPRGSLVLLVGPPGSGKTTMAAAMAFAAAKRGRRHRRPDRLVRSVR